MAGFQLGMLGSQQGVRMQLLPNSSQQWGAVTTSDSRVERGEILKESRRRNLIFPRRKAGQSSRVDKVPIELNYEIISKLFCLALPEAAERLGISATAFKAACRRLGVTKWPFRASQRSSAAEVEAANAAAAATLGCAVPAEKQQQEGVSSKRTGAYKRYKANKPSAGQGGEGGEEETSSANGSSTGTSAEDFNSSSNHGTEGSPTCDDSASAHHSANSSASPSNQNSSSAEGSTSGDYPPDPMSPPRASGGRAARKERRERECGAGKGARQAPASKTRHSHAQDSAPRAGFAGERSARESGSKEKRQADGCGAHKDGEPLAARATEVRDLRDLKGVSISAAREAASARDNKGREGSAEGESKPERAGREVRDLRDLKGVTISGDLGTTAGDYMSGGNTNTEGSTSGDYMSGGNTNTEGSTSGDYGSEKGNTNTNSSGHSPTPSSTGDNAEGAVPSSKRSRSESSTSGSSTES